MVGMKHVKPLLLLATMALLASCSTSSTSTSSSAASEATTSSTTSSSSVAPSSSASSYIPSYDLDALRSAYGAFSIVKSTTDGNIQYDEESNTYTLSVAASKAEYVLTGYFDGAIKIENPNALSAYKGVTITLSSACLIANGDSPAIYYSLESKNVEIKAKNGTANKILSFGNGVAVESANNVEFSGKGNLEMASTYQDVHTVRAQGEIRIYGEATINVSYSAHDAFHGNYMVFAEDSSAPTENPFLGTLTVSHVVSQAFDCETSKGKGYINVCNGTVLVDDAESVFKTDTKITIGSGAKVTATNISGDPYVQGDNSSGLTLEVNGSFTCNGTIIS